MKSDRKAVIPPSRRVRDVAARIGFGRRRLIPFESKIGAGLPFYPIRGGSDRQGRGVPSARVSQIYDQVVVPGRLNRRELFHENPDLGGQADDIG